MASTAHALALLLAVLAKPENPSACPAPPANLVPNGGMEGEYVNGVAPGWASNCYGDNDVRFEKETANPHSGKAAQKIICTRFGYGGVQIRCAGISVQRGKAYTLQAWLRAENISSPVLLCVRKHGKPYTKYIAQYVRVSGEWRRFTVIAKSTDTDPDCGIYIWFGSTGTLWIDDVSLRPGIHKPTTPSTQRPPVKGNRVYNSSVELGLAGWMRAELADGGWDGDHCLRIKPGNITESRPFITTPGQLHTVSFYARSPSDAKSPPKLSVEICEYADKGADRPVARDHTVAEFQLTQQWRRYNFKAVLEAPYTCGYMLRLRAYGGDALVDAVQVEEGDLTDYAPAKPIELAIELPVLKRYPLPRQPVEPTVHLWRRNRPGQVEVRLAWQDFFGDYKPAAHVKLRLDANGTAAAKVRCRGCDFGIYRLVARTDEDCLPGELVFGVLPADDGQRRPNSFFGTHAQVDPRSQNIAAVLARRAGMRWFRLHDFNHGVQWIHCEPERHGEYRWADEQILDLHRRGFCLLGTLVRTPKWAGRDYPPDKPASVQARVPRKLEWFADFTRAVAARYRGVIDHWEMWNEPYGWGFWAGTPEEYVHLERLGYQAAKQANPSCRVVGMCIYTGARDWVRRAVAAGGLKWLDIISFHIYISPGWVIIRPNDRSPLERMVLHLRGLLREAGRPDVPIWDSEGGVRGPSFYSWLPRDAWSVTSQQAAATVTKACAQLMSQGVEKWFYYFLGYAAGGPGSYYLMHNFSYIQLDVDGSPKPTLLAHAAAARFLDERPFIGRAIAPQWAAYVFDDNGRGLAVAWARHLVASHDRRVRLSLSHAVGDVQVFDIMGRARSTAHTVTLSNTPCYLRTSANPYRLLSQLRSLAHGVGH